MSISTTKTSLAKKTFPKPWRLLYQAKSEFDSELVAPLPNEFIANGGCPCSQHIFDRLMTRDETIM
jgi:hypothetical protein